MSAHVTRDQITATWLYESGIDQSAEVVADMIEAGLISGCGGDFHRADDLEDQLMTLTEDDLALLREWKVMSGTVRPE